MRIVEDIRETTLTFPWLALTIGSFDGVHLGHRRVLDEVVRAARKHGGTPAVLTTRPHPREFFSPAHAPNLLTCDAKKFALLEAAGIEAVLILPFCAATARLSAERFFDDIVVARCRAKTIVVGHDFCFGKDALGNFEYLARAASAHAIDVLQVSQVTIEGERVSSTAVRERILEGDLEEAEVFLGRKYSLTGRVAGGRGIGKQLGFPTANIEPHHSAVPAQGVYIAEAVFRGRRYPAAVNIGIAPTIRHEAPAIEAFLLDFDGEIRGEDLEIVFHKRLRSEQKFVSRDALIEQIGKDVDAVRAYFG